MTTYAHTTSSLSPISSTRAFSVALLLTSPLGTKSRISGNLLLRSPLRIWNPKPSGLIPIPCSNVRQIGFMYSAYSFWLKTYHTSPGRCSWRSTSGHLLRSTSIHPESRAYFSTLQPSSRTIARSLGRSTQHCASAQHSLRPEHSNQAAFGAVVVQTTDSARNSK